VDEAGRPPVFFEVRKLAFGAVTASMIAYLAAQLCDVYLFHFWKRLTRGRHLWLRNNGSTLISQLVDTVAVILITYEVGGLDMLIGEGTHVPTLLATLIFTGYAIKMCVALADTIPFYIGTHYLSRYLRIDLRAEHGGEVLFAPQEQS
jgi:queuosine precursor transporter